MIYVVEKDDDLHKIAERFGIPVEKIVSDNGVEKENNVVPGQALFLSLSKDKKVSEKGKRIGGFVAAGIEPSVLGTALSALTDLLIFSYGFAFDGKIVPPAVNQAWLLDCAVKFGIKPRIVLTPFSEGAFNNQLVKILLENKEIQERLINNLALEAEKKYKGVHINFKYILPENKNNFIRFLERMQRAMNEKGCSLSVSVAPKESDGQKGFLVEGMDYELIGKNADEIFLTTYEWGDAYGPPMASAPLDKVRRVIEYAAEKIRPDKLLLGIPNYGYDWMLPYEKGLTRGCVVGNDQAVSAAFRYNTEIEYAGIAQCPWYTYRAGGMEHVVWFEDTRSICAKWNLVREYGLAGAWYKDLNRPFQGNWSMLEETMKKEYKNCI